MLVLAILQMFLYHVWLLNKMAGLNVNMLTNMLAYHSLCVLLISVIIRVICGALVSNYGAINLTYPVAVFVKFQHGYCIDTVCHSAVLQKLAQLDIPDHIFNRISDYLQDHSHCTVYNSYSSDLRTVSASIIQGWCRDVIVCSRSCWPEHGYPDNLLCKYADDTLLFSPVIPIHD